MNRKSWVSSMTTNPSRNWFLRTFVSALFALPLFAGSKNAQAQNSSVFVDTPRYLIAREASLANAQVFGAVRAFDRLVGSKYPGTVNFGFQFNAVYAATSVPAVSGDRALIMQDVDLFANNLAVQVCSPTGMIKFCGFYSSAVTMTLAPDNIGSRIVGSLNSFTGLLIYNHIAAPLAVAGVTEGRSGLNAVQYSVMGGGTFAAGDFVQARAGFIGSLDQRGLYANVHSPRLKAFVTTALTDQLKELNTLMAGFEQLDPTQMFSEKGVLDKQGPLAVSAYYRQLKMKAPRIQDAALNAGQELIGQFDFNTIHAAIDRLGDRLQFEAHFAFATKPKPTLHELRAGANLGGNIAILRLGGGVTQFPHLPYYAVTGGLRPNFLAEIGVGREEAAFMKYSFRLNDAETLTNFPFAQNSFNMFFMLGGSLEGFRAMKQ